MIDEGGGNSSAIVFGGTSGLGYATAAELGRRGVRVIVVARDRERGERAAKDLRAAYQQGDVLDEEAVWNACESAAAMAPLRFVAHCAGIGHAERTIGRSPDRASAHSLAAFRHVVDVNLAGAFNVVRLAASVMAQQPADVDGQRGAIVLTGSLAASQGQTGQAAYAASKAGIVGMMRPIARDLSSVGIRLNTIVPGGFDTPIYGPDGPPQQLVEKVSAAAIFPRRMGQAHEFATLAMELLTNRYLNATAVELSAGTTQLPR